MAGNISIFYFILKIYCTEIRWSTCGVIKLFLQSNLSIYYILYTYFWPTLYVRGLRMNHLYSGLRLLYCTSPSHIQLWSTGEIVTGKGYSMCWRKSCSSGVSFTTNPQELPYPKTEPGPLRSEICDQQPQICKDGHCVSNWMLNMNSVVHTQSLQGFRLWARGYDTTTKNIP